MAKIKINLNEFYICLGVTLVSVIGIAAVLGAIFLFPPIIIAVGVLIPAMAFVGVGSLLAAAVTGFKAIFNSITANRVEVKKQLDLEYSKEIKERRAAYVKEHGRESDEPMRAEYVDPRFYQADKVTWREVIEKIYNKFDSVNEGIKDRLFPWKKRYIIKNHEAEFRLCLGVTLGSIVGIAAAVSLIFIFPPAIIAIGVSIPILAFVGFGAGLASIVTGFKAGFARDFEKEISKSEASTSRNSAKSDTVRYYDERRNEVDHKKWAENVKKSRSPKSDGRA